MALHRGIQSVIFYYASCAPCSEVRVRKKRKQDAERDRADREELEAHTPGLYRHPDPSSTNPYWQVEIDAGPVPLRTRKKQAEHNKVANSTKSNIASSVSVNAASDALMERSDSAKSGLDHFQRQDEVLWGSEAYGEGSEQYLSIDHLPKQLPRAKLNDQSAAYHHRQNPAINDMHPPTTRKVTSRDEVAWMLQPPPLPEIMSGKEAVIVNRSVSNLSRHSMGSRSTLVSRQASQRRGERNGQAVETLAEVQTLSHDDGVRRESTSQLPLQRSRTLPVRNSQHLSKPKNAAIREPPPALQLHTLSPYTHQRKRSRPQLSTVHSENLLAEDLSTRGAENNDPRRATSFNTALPQQSQATPRDRAAARLKRNSSQFSWIEARFVVPRQDSVDDSDGNTSSDNFDEAWHGPESDLPQWIHEHTKREVRQRWSFDI